MKGPMLRWYLENIRDVINSGKGLIEIEKCMEIDISEGYNAFMNARFVYLNRVQR